MTIGETYTWMTDRLKTIYDEREASSVTGLVMESRMGLQHIDRILRRSEPLDPSAETRLAADVDALLRNEPVQYVLGEAWFDGLLLKVDRHVLIPRPETEELVQWVAADIAAAAKSSQASSPAIASSPAPTPSSGAARPAILDIGTGSGCIPIALRKRLPHAELTGLDISPDALAVARENGTRYAPTVQWIQADILDETHWNDLPVYDIIVSNPPYIASAERSDMHTRVLAHEPHLALFVPDEDPLLFYRGIARFCKTRLCAGGALYLEINEALGEETKTLLQEEGFGEIILKKDLQEKDRMIRAKRGA